MPRSSRHKSSKYGSREAMNYSDSEKDSSLKERKTREGSVSHRGSKEYASGEKRKYDSKSVEDKEFVRSGNDDFVEEYRGSSSKKRREKVDDDRWTGEVDDRELMKTDKDSKGLGDLKSRSIRRDESSGLAVNTDEGKRSGSKFESKHYRSERKQRGEKEGLDRDRKAKDYSKSERFADGEAGAEVIGGEGSRKQLAQERKGKDATGNTGINMQDDLWNPETEREVERRVRSKKDSVGDMDKYPDGSCEINDGRISSKDDTSKFVKYKDSGHKDDKYKDKYRDDVEKDYHFQGEKQPRDGFYSRDYINARSDDKYSSSRIEKKDLDMQAKKLKPQDGERENDCGRYHRHHDDRDRDDRDHDGDRDHDNDRDRGRDHDRDRGRDVDRDRGRDLDRDRERGRDLDRDRDRERYRREREWERDRACDRDFTHDHGQEWDHDHDRDHGSHFDERNSRYKEDRGWRKSPDDYDDYYYQEKSKKVKADADAYRERSATCRTLATGAAAGSSRGRLSPSSKSHVYVDKYRDNMHDDMKYGDSREVVGCPVTPEKSSKHHSADKHSKLNDYCSRDPSAERSPGTRASPLVRTEKSPSTSIDRKYVKRPVRRQSLDVDEADRRSSGSNDVRDGSVNDDRQSRDMTSKKSLGEDYSPVESSFHHRGSQGNGSSFSHGPPNYRAGADSPSFMGSMGEDSRGPPSSRYRRNVDQNVGRAHVNPWKGVPNWASPLSNGFMPFPPGPQGPPPHGGFPGMLPQFPSSPIFGVRPPMEINHSAIPYHLPDLDRFPSHMRPLGWNMVDGLGPSHFHGWDGNNSLFRDEPPFYGPGNMLNDRSRESVVEPWKQNAVMMNIDTTPMYRKDGHVMKPSIDEAQAAQGAQESLNESSQRKTPSRTQKKETLLDMDKTAIEKTIELSDVDNAGNSLRVYLSKLDISIELTDPELYNECVNLAALKQSEDIVEVKTGPINLEKGEALDSIMDTNMDMKLFPVAEDSIFQRAMDLYKTHSSVRRSSLISEAGGKNMPIPSLPSPEGKETEQVAPKEELVEELVRESYESQASSASVNLLPASGGQNEQVVPTPAKETNTTPSMYPSEKSKPVPEDVNHENPSAKVAPHSDAAVNLDINNDTEMTNVEEVKGKSEEEEEPAPPCAEENELLGSSNEVSDPLILSHGSSVNKVCEALVPPNESKSVILTRIHQNAPGSTH